MLFTRSITGYDTTLVFFGIGKGTAFTEFVKNEDFKNITNFFMNPKATYSKVEKADERAALIICNSKEKIMDLVRDKELATKVVK